MIRGATDRLLARWEVGRWSGMPSILHVPIAGTMSVGSLALILFGGRASALVMLTLLAAWLVLLVADISRGVWLLRHPYASRRWLDAVSSVLDAVVFSQAIERLNRRFDHDTAYVVKRSDVAADVRAVRTVQRDMARRSEGLSLGALPVIMDREEARHGAR